MPSIHSAFPSNYIRAVDLGTHRVTVTVSHLRMEDVGGDGEKKPVLYFQGKERGLVLNKTNANSVCEVAGTDDYTQWAGVKIVLYATTTDFKGKTTPCIRIDRVPGQVQPPPPPPEAEEDPNIPF